MAEDKYKKGNGCIALYMGGTIVEESKTNLGTLDNPNIVHVHYLFDMGKNRTMNECYWADTTMKYHKDWNWLMPVLTKIRQSAPVMTINDLTPDIQYIYDIFRLTIFTPIETVWDYCILYIEWINKQS